MSFNYDNYIDEHKNNVERAFEWLLNNNILEGFSTGVIEKARHQCLFSHDHSKYNEEEYNAYDAYFYGGNRSYEVVSEFNKAWLHHIHNNPHHWQYWILINDDPDKAEVILDMPDEYIIEMICDWWSFSWKQNNLREIFNWYDEHSPYMKLSDNTRHIVENILKNIDLTLSEGENK